jgi:hypothetical protein
MYDQHTRDQAKALYAQHSAAYVADKLNIPERTVQRWAKAERWPRALSVAQDSTKTAEDRRHSAILGWHSRRQHMVDQLGHVGAQLLEAIQQDLAQRKRLNLRDAGILLGIMLDKAELLSQRTGWDDDLGVSAEQSIVQLNHTLDVLEQRVADGG